MASENPFDIPFLRELFALMKEHDVADVELEFATGKLRLSRGGPAPQVVSHPEAVVVRPPEPTKNPSSAPAAAPTSQDEEVEDDNLYVVSPIVGTFYTRPGPDQEDFVRVGQRIESDTVVCIVEAMKVFNEITAGVSGTVAEVLVENQAPVEFNQPLFRVRP